MRRLAIALLGAAAVRSPCWAPSRGAAEAASAPAATTAAQAPEGEPAPGPVDVLQVSGLFDPIVVDAIEQAIDRAPTDGAQALILQVEHAWRGRRRRRDRRT